MDTSSESGLPEADNNSGQDELAADISAGNNADIRMPSGTDDPLSDAEIQKYREEINKMDRIILDAVKRRTKVSQAIGKTRMGSGGTRLVHTREISILNQFRDELGEEGPAIASALLRMGRGKLG
ncbi:MAG: chorismate mutase [Corynebacterium casei]|uniref:chorismate mutase n=1 Tax=Corynebacterium casei TaxID=160386 RepID=UPI003F8FB4C1